MANPHLATVGQRILDLRVRRGWTRAELAARIGITAAAVAAMEQRVHQKLPQMDRLRKYAAALEVGPEVLLLPEPAMRRPGGGGAAHAQAEILEILGRSAQPMSTRQVSEEHGADAWRPLDALRRRGLISLDRSLRPHRWRRIDRRRSPGILEVLAEITAQVVVASDGRRYLLVPSNDDLRDA